MTVFQVLEFFAALAAWLLCGYWSWGFFLANLLRQMEENRKKLGLVTGKEDKKKMRAILRSAFISRMILGPAGLIISSIFNAFSGRPVVPVFSLSPDFWEKYFKKEQP